jgi:hypothetical protein
MRPLDFVKRHIGQLVLLFVVGYSLVYALAFVGLYFAEHPYRVASAWIFDNVPPGSRIAGSHWDDRVPVGIPNHKKSPANYVTESRDLELPFYEQDNLPTIQLLLRRMSNTDYIAFATPRVADSIPRIADEYPRTTALIQLLWAEKLGFTLEKTVKNRPSFSGITFNDDLADESFSVYDHPKVVIFKNVEHLSPEQLFDRIKNVDAYRPLPTMNEILLMDQGGWQAKPTLWNPEWWIFLRAVAVVGIIGFSCFVFVGPFLTRFPDRGLGLSGALGVLGGVACAWGAARAALLPFSGAAGRCLAIGFFVVAMVRWSLRPDVRRVLSQALRAHLVWVAGAFVGGIAVVTVMRSGDPSFFGLGDRVDATYLSYFVRNESLSVQDILHPGRAVSPLLLDRLVLGWLLKVADVPLPLLHAVAQVVIGGLLGTTLYSIMIFILRRPGWALAASGLVVIPLAYGLHAVREVPVEGAVSAPLAQLSDSSLHFVAWATKNVTAAPIVLEACEDDAVRGTSALAGLPIFVEGPDSNGGVALCASADPNLVFQGMMKQGLPLMIAAGIRSGSNPVSSARLASFDLRPDLFKRIYDNGAVVVYAPAFSEYFRGAQEPSAR